jgi:hypothetical protein
MATCVDDCYPWSPLRCAGDPWYPGIAQAARCFASRTNFKSRAKARPWPDLRQQRLPFAHFAHATGVDELNPASSRVAWIAAECPRLPLRGPRVPSMKFTISMLTPARRASSGAVQPNNLRAARTCAPVITKAPLPAFRAVSAAVAVQPVRPLFRQGQSSRPPAYEATWRLRYQSPPRPFSGTADP